MDNEIAVILNKIDNEIIKYESQFDSYKKDERKILEKFTSFNEFLDNDDKEKFMNLIYSCIIKNEKYNKISALTKNKEYIPLYMMTEYMDVYLDESYNDYEEKIKKCLCIYEMYNSLDENTENITNSIVNFYEILSYIDKNDLLLLNIFFTIYNTISTINLDEFKFSSTKEKMYEFRNMSNNEGIKDNIDKINNLFNGILVKKEKYTNESKNFNKINVNNIKRLKNLKQKLLLSLNKEEISNIDEMVELSTDDFKVDVVNYINLKNEKYNKKLEEKYLKLEKNSISNYIFLFKKYNIDFRNYSTSDQKYIMMLGIDFVKIIFEFLNKINFNINKNVIKIICSTNTDIIENIEKYVKLGFITYNYVNNNIEIIFDNDISDESFYNKFIKNMNILLENKTNIKGLDENGMEFYKEDPELIKKNIEILNKMNININTRNLKNYNFLRKNNLSLFIKSLLKVGIDINNNIDILNSDFNIVKRIFICNELNIDIYEDGMLRQNILNKDLFFVPDSKIDEYVNEKTLVLN